MLLDRKRSPHASLFFPLALLVTLVPGAARAGQGAPASPAPASPAPAPPAPAPPAPAPPVPGSPSPAPAWKLDAETAPDRAQLSSRKLRAVRVETPPKIDGDLSDPVWEQAARAGTFSDAFTFSTAIDQTEARVCYDSEAIYVAFYCRDSRPEAVVAREIRRDAQFQGEDTVSVVLDPYRTRRGNDSNYFVVNALGTGASYIAGGRAGKREWKGDWESAARRVEDGWTAEMRIPWQILNFPARSEPSTIGLNFQRRQQRTDIRSFWSNLGPNERSELAGDWEEVQLPKSSFKRELSLCRSPPPATISAPAPSSTSASAGPGWRTWASTPGSRSRPT